MFSKGKSDENHACDTVDLVYSFCEAVLLSAKNSDFLLTSSNNWFLTKGLDDSCITILS